GGFDQCYNAQAAVAAGSLLVVAGAVSQAPNDKQQLEPMLDKIEALPDELGKPECLLADTGYFSAANVAACEKAGIEPLIAMGRQPHHPPSAERFEAAPEAPEDPTPVEAMAHRLKTPAGRALYALRKQMPEPVCECAPNRDPTAECANHLTRNTNSTPREGSRQMQNETPQESQIILFDQCLQRFSAWDPGSVKNHIYAAVCAKGSAEHRLGGRCLGAPQPAYMARNSISSAYGGAARR